MKKRLFSLLLATILVASLFAACGKTEDTFVAPTQTAETTVAPTTEAPVLTMEAYLTEDNRVALEEQFQLAAAIEGLEDTYTGVSLGAEDNTLYIDYFFTESMCPADKEETYREAFATSLASIDAATFYPVLGETEAFTGIKPSALGFRYYAASGNELGELTYTVEEIEAANQAQ